MPRRLQIYNEHELKHEFRPSNSSWQNIQSNIWCWWNIFPMILNKIVSRVFNAFDLRFPCAYTQIWNMNVNGYARIHDVQFIYFALILSKLKKKQFANNPPRKIWLILLGFLGKLNITELVQMSQLGQKWDINTHSLFTAFIYTFYRYIMPKNIYSVLSPICCKKKHLFETKIYVAHWKAYDFWKINKTKRHIFFVWFSFMKAYLGPLGILKKSKKGQIFSVDFRKNSRLQRYLTMNFFLIMLACKYWLKSRISVGRGFCHQLNRLDN